MNENEYAQKMIDSASLGTKPFETLRRVARYYIDQGYNKNDVRKKLDYFILQCDPSASLVKVADVLDKALKQALKQEAIQIDSIDITQPEIDTINSLNGRVIKRLAFTLLCIAKYWNIAKGSDYWTSNEDSEIMKMANIVTSIKKQDEMYRELWKLRLIDFSRKVDNTNVKVLFVQDGDVVMQIRDLRNLGYQFLKFLGGDFYECQNCGLICKPKKNKDARGRHPKYCPDCAREIYLKQTINSVMRGRAQALAVK